jgi:hypothetical protein
MKIETLIKLIKEADGNLKNTYGDIFITPSNLEKLFEYIDVKCEVSLLITPYLITNDQSVYELQYYELEIDIGGDTSYVVEYNENNLLPNEIIENLKPRAIVAKGDDVFFTNVLRKYIDSMHKMSFVEDRNSSAELENARLYYQIF